MYPLLYTAYSGEGATVHVVVVRQPGTIESMDLDGREVVKTDVFDDPQVGIGHLRTSFLGQRNVKASATEAEIENAFAAVQDEIDDMQEDERNG